ncbi:MAG: sodium:solute symporter [Bryobacteraceae bacterium]
MQQRWLDLSIMVAYMVAMAAVGIRFARKQTSTESYFVAKRSIPSWAMGLSIVATLITSVTFVAYPGSSYGKNWSLLVPGFMVVIALALVGAVIIPFYRHVIGMSAYEYFGKRFGRPTRLYSSLAFSLAHFSKMGFVFYLLALTVNSMTGWSMDVLIVVVGLVTIFYTVVGGLEAVIWTDVIQGFVIWIGVFVALGYLLFLPPGGPSAVFQVAWENHKFSLGTWDADFSQQQNLYVLILYGFFWYLQKYTADQTVVQRYLVAKTDRAAIRGVAFGALLCVPVWTLFMLIGTCTWAFYKLTGESLPSYVTKADQVFPYFLTVHLPPGMAGLFMASLMGAAMSGLASDLSALAVVGVEDFYRSYRPQATDGQRLRGGKWIVAVAGALCMVIAIVLAHSKGGALSMWFSVSAIVSGGLAGLFLLAFLSTRANRQGIYIGILATVLFTAWATATSGDQKSITLVVNYPWHSLTIGAVGHIVLIVVGYVASLFFPAEQSALSEMTLWKWLETRKHLAVEPS